MRIVPNYLEILTQDQHDKEDSGDRHGLGRPLRGARAGGIAWVTRNPYQKPGKLMIDRYPEASIYSHRLNGLGWDEWNGRFQIRGGYHGPALGYKG